MLDSLRQQVLAANLELARSGLARFTFGNASAIDRAEQLVVIKPSGVPYDHLTPNDLVVTDLGGRVMEGKLRPSSDLPTHLVLYESFKEIGGVAHTHSHFATVWAQARREIPCVGTTHADYFRGPVPVTAMLSDEAIGADYEEETGRSIVRRLEAAGLDPLQMPAALVAGHAPFCWGRTVADAAQTAALLEEVARMAFHTLVLDAGAELLPAALLEKHFRRKHGAEAYYGQPKEV